MRPGRWERRSPDRGRGFACLGVDYRTARSASNSATSSSGSVSGTTEAVAHLAHDDGDRGLERLGHRGENLGAGLFLTALDLAEVAQGHARATGHLAQRHRLLQTVVTENIADFLTDQNHGVLLTQFRGVAHATPSNTENSNLFRLRDCWDGSRCNVIETPVIPRSSRSASAVIRRRPSGGLPRGRRPVAARAPTPPPPWRPR